MTYKFRPAERSQAKPLIGLYSESGAGKTYGALLIARGFVGPDGDIGMIETESGRGEAYASPDEYPEIAGSDKSKSNYQVLSLRDDFSPATYGEAITAAEKARLDALIIDSASHEWEGAGGVLSMAAANQESHKKGPLIWQKPKLDHQRHFMLRFMQTSVPLVILCMRAKYPMREIKKPNGSKEWARSEYLDPKQADDILFEMFVHGWIGRGDHAFHLTKCTANSLKSVFAEGKMLSLDTGRKLADWANDKDGTGKAKSEASEIALAEVVAKSGGIDGLKEFWTSRSKEQKLLLKPEMARIKELAAQADGEPDDPFGEDETEPTAMPANGEAEDTDAESYPYFARAQASIESCVTVESLDKYWADQEKNGNLKALLAPVLARAK